MTREPLYLLSFERRRYFLSCLLLDSARLHASRLQHRPMVEQRGWMKVVESNMAYVRDDETDRTGFFEVTIRMEDYRPDWDQQQRGVMLTRKAGEGPDVLWLPLGISTDFLGVGQEISEDYDPIVHLSQIVEVDSSMTLWYLLDEYNVPSVVYVASWS